VIAQDETPNVKTAVEALAPEGVKVQSCFITFKEGLDLLMLVF
jgi:hypothetical protein